MFMAMSRVPYRAPVAVQASVADGGGLATADLAKAQQKEDSERCFWALCERVKKAAHFGMALDLDTPRAASRRCSDKTI